MKKVLKFFIVFTIIFVVDDIYGADNSSLLPKINPDLKFPTLKSYEKECKESGLLLEDERLILFAPKRKSREASIIFGYLLKAYDELYHIVGSYPKYKIVVYHFPEDNEHGWGGTSECTIWYSYKNLDFDSQKEWIQYKVPHLSGYIEEMAHNFDEATGAQFGWEMIGWNLGIKATAKVAPNPVFIKHLRRTREVQKETFQRYLKNGYRFPKDLPGNLCDRIHAHILWLCEQRYKGEFWKDLFKEIQKEQLSLANIKNIRIPNMRRDKRYQITVESFDRLEDIKFKNLLERYHISQTVAVKSLRPTDENWDRRLVEPEDYRKSIVAIDANTLTPLHLASYQGHYKTAEQLIRQGNNINEKGQCGWTPLHMAAIGGHKMLSEMLLSKGADLSLLDDHKRNATALAEICGHNGLAEYLRSRTQ